MPHELKDQVDVHLQHDDGSVNPEPPLDVWSDAFRACLGAWTRRFSDRRRAD